MSDFLKLTSGCLAFALALAAPDSHSQAGPDAPSAAVPDTLRTPAVPEAGAPAPAEVASRAAPRDSVPGDTSAASAYEMKKMTVTGRSRALTRKESDFVARMPLKNLENPQSYVVVPKELIDQQVTVDYNSAYKNIPGSSKGLQWMQGHSSFYTRGFMSTPEVRNGLSVNVVNDADLANVERIEAIRGPAGALFGSGSGVSYGGLFNTVTKTPFETFKGNVSASGGSWSLGRAAADVNLPLNAEKTLLLRVNGAKHNEGSFMDQGYTDSWVLAPTLAFAASDRLKLTLDVEAYQKQGTSILTTSANEGTTARSVEDLGIGYARSFTDNSLETESRTTNLFAKAEYRLTEGWTTETVVAATSSQSDLYSIYLYIYNDSTANRYLDYQAWKVNTRQAQQNLRGEFNVGPVRNQLLLGLGVSAYDYRWPYTVYSDSVHYRTLDQNYYVGLEQYRSRIASLPLSMWTAENYTYYAYASDAVHFGDRFTVLLGLRWDRFDERGGSDGISELSGRYEQDALSPKAGIVFQPVKDALSLYANYLEGYKNVNGRSFDGENFDPEKARQGEVGVKVQMAGGRLTGTLAGYYVQVRDVVRADTTEGRFGFSIQDGTQYSQGVEADILAQPIPGLSLVAGYAFNQSKLTDADSTVEGRRPPSAGPELAANFWASYEMPEGPARGLGAGLGGNYASRAYHKNTDTFVFTVPAYLVLDATVFYDRPAYRIGLKVDNLADTKYWSPEYLQAGMPRRVIGNLTYKF